MQRFDRTIWFGTVTVCWMAALVVLALRPDLLTFGGLAWGRRAQLRHLVGMAALGLVAAIFLRRFDRDHFGPIRTTIATVMITGATTVAIVLARNVSEQDLTSAGSRTEVVGAMIGLLVGLIATSLLPLDRQRFIRGLLPPAGLAAAMTIAGAAVVVGGDVTVASTENCEPAQSVNPERSRYVRRIDAVDVALTFDRRGDAEITSDGVFVMNGGSFRSAEAGAEFERVVRKSNQFTVSVWIRSADVEQSGPARIVTVSDGISDQQMNMHLGQEDDRLSFRVRNTCDLFNWVVSTPVLAGDGRDHHVVVSYGGGVATIIVDGQVNVVQDIGAGDLSNWDPDFFFVIGDETTDNRAFRGEIHNLAVFDRLLNEGEIRELYRAGW